MLMLRTSVYKACSKCPLAALMHAWSLLRNDSTASSIMALWQVRPDRLQDGLQLRNVRWLRYIALILVKHRTRHMIGKRVAIRRIRWPPFRINSGQFRLSQSCTSDAVWAVAKLSFFSSDSCNFCFMSMIWNKFSENTVVFLSIIWCKFQEFKLHRFREIEFFLGGCFLCRTL